MMRIYLVSIVLLALSACGGGKKSEPAGSGVEDAVGGESQGPSPTADAPASPAAAAGAGSEAADASEGDDAMQLKHGQDNQIDLRSSDASKRPGGVSGTKIKATRTEAAVRFVVVDKEKGPIPGIVVCLAAPNGRKYYTGESDEEGFAEVLVPNGQQYEVEFLSLGRRKIAAKLPITDEPNQNIKLTLRYKRHNAKKPDAPAPTLVLEGVHFDTGKATLRDDSFGRLDAVVEFMTYKPSARVEISGHTDNVGNRKRNKALSKRRAEACREYLIAKGIEPSRVEAVGFGDERPIAPNETAEGRQLNRRIEAREL